VLARGGLLGLVFLAFWLWALVDVIRTPDGTQRNLPKVAWVFIVFLFSFLGALAWVTLGRPHAATAEAGFGTGTPRPPRPRRQRRLSDNRDDVHHLSERERYELERREYYKRMDEELDRRLEEKRSRDQEPD
jgi:hypothetical protein